MFILIVSFLVTLTACQNGGNYTKTGVLGSSSTGSISDPLPAQAKAVLNTNCNTCHGFTSQQAMIDQGVIVPGNLAASKVYQRLTANTMPPTGPLPAASKQILFDWISQGAAAFKGSYFDPESDLFYVPR